jgi:hypothetical protein
VKQWNLKERWLVTVCAPYKAQRRAFVLRRCSLFNTIAVANCLPGWRDSNLQSVTQYPLPARGFVPSWISEWVVNEIISIFTYGSRPQVPRSQFWLTFLNAPVWRQKCPQCLHTVSWLFVEGFCLPKCYMHSDITRSQQSDRRQARRPGFGSGLVGV